VVVATPVYKAAYSGILKAFLDLLPQFGLTNKLVLPLATGGSQSHMLALDYALRPVLSSLNPKHVLPSIYATEAQVTWRKKTAWCWMRPSRPASMKAWSSSASLQALHKVAPEEFREIPFSQLQYSVSY
jgi:FMN reductase